MKANREQAHVLVLPEDDLNRELANGFLLNLNLDARRLQVLPVARGWTNVLKEFELYYAGRMRQYPQCHMVLLIDFDGDESRRGKAMRRVPADLAERVFVLGIMTEPEDLRKDFPLESLGTRLASECDSGAVSNVESLWNHRLLLHNHGEVLRLREQVHHFLFHG